MLLSYGPRRPDWSRTGPPSRLEWSSMHAHRRWVLAGYPSLHAGAFHAAQVWLRRTFTALDEIRVLVEAAAKRWGIRLRRQASASSALTPAQSIPHPKPARLPRPPGIADDHPLVLSGRYR